MTVYKCDTNITQRRLVLLIFADGKNILKTLWKLSETDSYISHLVNSDILKNVLN